MTLSNRPTDGPDSKPAPRKNDQHRNFDDTESRSIAVEELLVHDVHDDDHLALGLPDQDFDDAIYLFAVEDVPR